MSKDDRDEKVEAVLRTETKPLGPTEIARRIGEGWCGGLQHPSSSAIVPVLRRIGAVNYNGSGVYVLPDNDLITDHVTVKRIGHGNVFIDHGDGTVTDTRSGLMWMRPAVGQNWANGTCVGEAKLFSLSDAIAIRSDFAGYSDWHLPTIEMLKALIHRNQRPALDEQAFPAQSGCYFWSQSLNTADAEEELRKRSLILKLSSGDVEYTKEHADPVCVRLVRKGLRFFLEAKTMDSRGGVVHRSPNKVEYYFGSTVTLSAQALKGFKFKRWHGDATGQRSTCCVTMDSDKTVSAEFIQLGSFALDVAATGTGSGRVMRSVNAATYFSGSTVTLTAEADEGSIFIGWHGAATGQGTACTVTMDSAKTVSAEFVQLESFALDVAATGTGSGRVMRSVSAANYFSGSTVTLTAEADEGSIFNGWHGDATGMDDVCTVTLNASMSVSAEFRKTTISDTSISIEFSSIERVSLTAGRSGIAFYLTIRNKGVQPAHIKIPLTSYVRCNDQVCQQSTWDTKSVGLVNGSKGATLFPGTFSQVGLVYERVKLQKGDHLYVNVEQAKPLGRICFTFRCMDTDGSFDSTFLLIHASSEDPKETEDSSKSLPTMASVLKRIESLEGALAEVLRKLDAIQSGYGHPIGEVPNKVGPSQTLFEVLAWMCTQVTVPMSDLRLKLLPLELMPSAVIDDINERAYDLAAEAAFEETGDAVTVQRGVLLQVLTAWEV